MSSAEKIKKTYKTQVNRLCDFFEESRNNWRERSAEKQKRIDFLETKVRDLSNSRDNWKEKYQQVKAELKKENRSKKRKKPDEKAPKKKQSWQSLVMEMKKSCL